MIYPPIRVFYDRIANREHEIESVKHLLACKSQGFGENPDMYAPMGLKGHNGLDWGLKEGTPIYASHNGRVTQVSTDEKAGLGVVITDSDKKTIYWHMSKVIAVKNVLVDSGDIIGLSGNTGFSTGPHLHFGYKPLINGNVEDRDNGFDGAVDPSPFFVWFENNMTREDVRNLYRLAFYREPTAQETDYWAGKPLADFLKTAIADRATFLQKP